MSGSRPAGQDQIFRLSVTLAQESSEGSARQKDKAIEEEPIGFLDLLSIDSPEATRKRSPERNAVPFMTPPSDRKLRDKVRLDNDLQHPGSKEGSQLEQDAKKKEATAEVQPRGDPLTDPEEADKSPDFDSMKETAGKAGFRKSLKLDRNDKRK